MFNLPTKLITRAEINVKGLVQGVSFRAYTKRRASALGLTGYVRNLPNGSVEVIVEGYQYLILQLIDWLKNEGSPGSNVTDLDINWSNKLEDFKSFIIKF